MNTTSPHHHRASCLALVLFAASLASAQAQQSTPPPAAPAPDEEKVLTLETYTVTGTNIKRLDQEKALPVSVINLEAIEARNSSSAVEFLLTLPQVVNVPLSESAVLGGGARGDNSAVSLRGLSTGNTLVLLNGRRLAPHPISQAESSVPSLSPNVNQLPNRGVERVEVLRDGASSIYGSDAVAGVINYLTDRNYRGTELILRYGYADAGSDKPLPGSPSSGEEYRATILHGQEFAGGKGRLVTTFDWFKRDEVLTRDRAFSAEADQTLRAPAPWNNYSTDTDFFFRVSSSAYGNFLTGTFNSTTGVFTGARPAGVSSTLVSSTGSFFFVPTATGVGFKTTTPGRTGIERDYYYNRGESRTIQPSSTRYNWYTSLEYDLSERLTAFADVSFYKADSTAIRDPESAARSTDGDLFVPAANPFNPFGTRFYSPTGAPNSDGTPRLTGTPSTVVIVNKRWPEFGNRSFTVESDVVRLLGGLRGKFSDTWTWESAALYTLARTKDEESGAIRESLFQTALNQTTPTTAFNPFAYNFAVQGTNLAVTGPYQNSRSVIDTFQQSFLREGETSIASLDFRTSGELMKIWGGNTLTLALGAEYRIETYDDTRPAFAGLNPTGSGLDPLDNDFLSFSPSSDTHADRNVAAAYVELNVPLVGNNFKLPLVQALDVTISGRYENYSDFGTTTKPKISGTWRPVSWAIIRGSYNEGFRAPNLAQLFTGELVRSVAATDSYRSNVTLLPSDGATARLFRRSGNANLQPEESVGKSAGIFIDVPYVKGLSLSVDYWEILQTGAIAASNGITDDNEALQAATQAALASGQAIGSIDLGSGTSNYGGDPSVQRFAVTQADRDAFALYNTSRPPSTQRAVVGSIDYIRETYFNRAERFVNGWDFEVAYRFPQSRFGNFTLSSEWTYIIDAHGYDKEGAARDDLRWQSGAPIWKGITTLTWRKGGWRAGLSANYIGDYQDADGSTTLPVWDALGRPGYIVETFDTGANRYRYLVDSLTSFNGYVSYRFRSKKHWLDDTAIRLGVINLTDAEPPLAADERGYTTNQYQSLARGRIWSIEVSKKL